MSRIKSKEGACAKQSRNRQVLLVIWKSRNPRGRSEHQVTFSQFTRCKFPEDNQDQLLSKTGTSSNLVHQGLNATPHSLSKTDCLAFWLNMVMAAQGVLGCRFQREKRVKIEGSQSSAGALFPNELLLTKEQVVSRRSIERQIQSITDLS